MKKRPITILSILLLLAAVATGFYYGTHPHEPSYQGRTARSWLIWAHDEHASYDAEVYEKTSAAFTHLGTNAIPPLLQMLRLETNSDFSLRCRALCDKVSFMEGPLLADEENHLAKWGLNMLGDAATNAIPELIKMGQQTNSTRLQYDAYEVLNAIVPTPASTAFLREGLTNFNNTIRLTAYEHFTRTNQPERMSLLIEELKDASPQLRNFAAYRLQLMGKAAKPAVPFLVPLAGVISNKNLMGAYSYNPAATALLAIDPETAARTLPPPFDWNSLPRPRFVAGPEEPGFDPNPTNK